MTVAIALLQAASSYVNAYFTVSIGQWIAHDLRHSVYGHLHRLSMSSHRRRPIVRAPLFFCFRFGFGTLPAHSLHRVTSSPRQPVVGQTSDT
jgi:ABC-type multidrug transport system fused ATPase/permease subunit